MKSPLAEAARRRLSEDVRGMSPEQRLAAFLAHCQLMVKLARADERGGRRLQIAERRRAD